MNFLEIDNIIKPTYYNSEDDTINDFLIPILKRTKIYKRQTYSFSSAFFSLINDALIDMISNGCKIYYIAGIELEPCDVQAIEDGILGKDGLIEEQIIYEFGKVENFIKQLSNKYDREKYFHRLKILSYLVSKDILNIRIGFVSKKGKIVDPGRFKFHPKVMIFLDGKGNTLVANGSPNESRGAHEQNEETFDVFKSWELGALPHLETHIKKFEQFWTNESNNVKTIEVNKLIEKRILPKYNAYKSKEEILIAEKQLNDIFEYQTEPNNTSVLWPHQEKAKKIFLEKKFGILEMATGTGKTRVALSILNQLFHEGHINGGIITTFGNDLLDQWYKELCTRASSKFIILRHYGDYREASDFVINPDSSLLLISKDFLGEFLSKNSNLVKNKILIFDEVHKMGAEKTTIDLKGKLDKFPYKLGLSATPERDYDEDGNQFIENELGPIIFGYNLKVAIADGILCEFQYVPLFYEYDEEDGKKRRRAYAKYQEKKEIDPLTSKKELYIELSRIKKLSLTKLPVFKEYLINNKKDLDRSIIFVEEKQYGEQVQKIIIDHIPDYHTYYGEDLKDKLSDFSEGNINCLITCDKISEGIDIRSINNIILFSASRAKLETIQRMGRCLRIDPQNPSKKAKIIDFIEKSEFEPQKNDEEFERSDYERYTWLTDLSNTKKREINGDT